MLLGYRDCIQTYETDYQLNAAIARGLLFKVERGIYSDSPSWSELALIVFKNNNPIFTMDSAFYYQDLTDTIPERYCIGTDRDASKIADQRIKQFFYPDSILGLGIEKKTINNVQINIYSKERLLVELIRHRNKIPFDYYKEIISSYRRKLYEIDEEWFEDNLDKFPHSRQLKQTIQLEVY